jgi:hypothetical protein
MSDVDIPLNYRPTGCNLTLKKHSSILLEPSPTITLRGSMNCFISNGRLVVLNVSERDVNLLNSYIYDMVVTNGLQGDVFYWNSDIPLFFPTRLAVEEEESFKAQAIGLKLQGFQKSNNELRGCVYVVFIE